MDTACERIFNLMRALHVVRAGHGNWTKRHTYFEQLPIGPTNRARRSSDPKRSRELLDRFYACAAGTGRPGRARPGPGLESWAQGCCR